VTWRNLDVQKHPSLHLPRHSDSAKRVEEMSSGEKELPRLSGYIRRFGRVTAKRPGSQKGELSVAELLKIRSSEEREREERKG